MSITLVGDSIENSWNVQTLLHAAEMFECGCLFRSRDQRPSWEPPLPDDLVPELIPAEQLFSSYAPIVAFDTGPRAEDIYGFRPPRDAALALVVGNERRGISGEIARQAQHAVQIPMVSRQINSLNVAAAAAVGLYYLARGGGQRLQSRAHPHRRRPELLFQGAGDHVELGSAIRSACAFGWERALVDDRAGIWFGCDRVTRSEGRGAARRGRNPIRLIPTTPAVRHPYAEVCVVTTRAAGLPLHRSDLARGPQQLIVIPDESELRVEDEPWERMGKSVSFIQLELPAQRYVYHYRLIASIVLAEAARQIGQRAPGADRRRPGGPAYEQALQLEPGQAGELVFLEDLLDF